MYERRRLWWIFLVTWQRVDPVFSIIILRFDYTSVASVGQSCFGLRDCSPPRRSACGSAVFVASGVGPGSVHGVLARSPSCAIAAIVSLRPPRGDTFPRPSRAGAELLPRHKGTVDDHPPLSRLRAVRPVVAVADHRVSCSQCRDRFHGAVAGVLGGPGM